MRFIAISCLALLTCCLILSPVKAEQQTSKQWHIDTSIGFFSDYMFRGFNLYPGASIQPSITATYDSAIGSFSGNLWMHLSADGPADGTSSFTELDESLRYSYSIDDFSFSTGIAWYTYPNSGDQLNSTTEVFASIAYDSFLNPVLSIFHDFDEFDAQYYELSFSHDFEITEEGVLLTPYAGFGFASNSEKVYSDNGFVQGTVGISLTIPIGEMQLIPSINYTFEADDYAVNEFWVGTVLLYSF